MDLLVFSPHPDDCEVACGGTIILSVRQGMEVAVADMTEGECSSRGSSKERKKEKDKATDLLGIQKRYSLHLPDTQLGTSPSHRIAVVNLIRQVRPRIVLAPYRQSRHPDHEATGRLVEEACFYGGVPAVGEGPTFRPEWVYYYMSDRPFIPTWVVDISSVWKQKLAVIGSYQTQFFRKDSSEKRTAISHPSYLRFQKALAIYFGTMAGVSFGEPFFSKGPLQLNGLPGLEKKRFSEKWSPKYKCF